jgi:hypothetical protein
MRQMDSGPKQAVVGFFGEQKHRHDMEEIKFLGVGVGLKGDGMRRCRLDASGSG